ncbi:MAG TPA: hypothetical protein VFA51_14930 [Candidatus Udaeobacter sp.]|nr:hypothetical protein [Candidatus Udaeobacter sp.]
MPAKLGATLLAFNFATHMLPPPSSIAPLEPEVFIGAYQYAGMVTKFEFPDEVQATGKPLIKTDDGAFALTRHPQNVFCLAVVRYFRGQPNKAKAFMWRYYALQTLMHYDGMNAYIKGVGGELEMHCAVFEVVATEKLSGDYEFEPERFFQRVREVTARMDAQAGNGAADGGE